MKTSAEMGNLLEADIYGITSEEHSLGRSNVETMDILLKSGIKVVQYREKDKPARKMYEECIVMREMARVAGATFIVNDRVDLAIAVAADGVHVGQGDLPPEVVRQLVGQRMIIGLSTHSPEEALAAEAGGIVDYIGVGPVFSTQTKKDASPPVGLEHLEFAVRHVSLPIVAIGGIKESNITELQARGARMFALISELVGSENIAAKVKSIRAALATTLRK